MRNRTIDPSAGTIGAAHGRHEPTGHRLPLATSRRASRPCSSYFFAAGLRAAGFLAAAGFFAADAVVRFAAAAGFFAAGFRAAGFFAAGFFAAEAADDFAAVAVF